MKRIMLCSIIMTLLTVFVSIKAHAADTNQIFERGALTPDQLNAWSFYIDSESAVFGCEYGDDPRLSEDLESLLTSLANDIAVEPVTVTYRTLLNMGPNTRTLLSNHIKIASMECNEVYYTGSELIGLPVIPFEEAITILHDDLANFADPERTRRLIKTFMVAGMDPRWFWTFFVADKAHMDMIGLDFETLVQVEQALYNRETPKTFVDDSYNLLQQIFAKTNNNSMGFYANSGQCEKTAGEPPVELLVWPEITDDIIKTLYNRYKIAYKGKWKTKTKQTEGGISLYQESALDNPVIPAFNIQRGITISSKECT
jgi:hypothetical protein